MRNALTTKKICKKALDGRMQSEAKSPRTFDGNLCEWYSSDERFPQTVGQCRSTFALTSITSHRICNTCTMYATSVPNLRPTLTTPVNFFVLFRTHQANTKSSTYLSWRAAVFILPIFLHLQSTPNVSGSKASIHSNLLTRKLCTIAHERLPLYFLHARWKQKIQ